MSTFVHREVSASFLGSRETVARVSGETRDKRVDVTVLTTTLKVWGCLELSGVLCAEETPVSCLGGAGPSWAPGRSLA